MMKVLWFCNGPADGIRYLKNDNMQLGNWLQSIQRALKASCECNVPVVFPWREGNVEFEYEGSRYYGLNDKSTSLTGRLRQKLFRHTQDDDPTFLLRVLKIVEKEKPDLINIHGTEMAFVRLLQRNLGIPIVVTLHSSLQMVTRKYWGNFDHATLRKAISLKQRLTLNSPYRQYRQFEKDAKREREVLRDAQYVIGRTDWDRRVAMVVAPNARYYLGENPVRKAFRENQWNPERLKDNVIVTTSSNCTYKGVETMMEAAHLLQQIPGFDFTWKIVGLAPDSYTMRAIKLLLKERYPKRNIEFLGFLNEKELLQALLGASVFVMPSHIECSPMVLYEAMTLGVPCISTLAGGSASSLIDHETGFLIQDGDPFAMAGAVLDMLRHPEEAMRLSMRGRELRLAATDDETVMHSYLNAYKDILSRNTQS